MLSENMRYPAKLVLKVNEIYHDIEGAEYEARYRGMFEEESARWQKIGSLFIEKTPEKISILDIGSGTGFVPLQIARFLKNDDLFVCSDISTEKLEVCRKNVLAKKFKVDFEFVKLDGGKITLSRKFDFVTLNSVLHHIPDACTFLKEIADILKPNGYLIIGHEPNKTFYINPYLWNSYRFISFVLNPKPVIRAIAKRLKLLGIFEKIHPISRVGGQHKLIQQVNKRLLAEHIVENPLSAEQITKIVDIHSPTAGRYHKDRGFDIPQLFKSYLPDFRVEHLETYNYLCKTTHKNKFTETFASLLKKKFPNKGATFFVVLKKTSLKSKVAKN